MSVAVVQQPEAAPGIAAVASENGSKGGRPTSLEALGIKSEDIWNLAAQGLSNAQISKRLSRSKGKISIRTIAKYRVLMPKDFKVQLDDFDSLPQASEYLTWLKSRYDSLRLAEQHYRSTKKIWEACWKKPLENLEESDLLKALTWIKENHEKSQFEFILDVRALIRFGVGKPEWLTKHLSTKGKKGQPRIVGLLTKPDFFETVLPQILSKVGELDQPERVKDELWLALAIKPASGIRTGDRHAERELWGTRINSGKSNLQYHSGKLQDWVVFAKRKEIWHIRYLPDSIRIRLLHHIAKYGIKTGEFLIQQLHPALALSLVRQICKSLDIEPIRLHDLRKAYLTGLCLSGVPLETAVDLNVGWKDINTARKYYLMIKALNAEKEYAKFTGRFFAS